MFPKMMHNVYQHRRIDWQHSSDVKIQVLKALNYSSLDAMPGMWQNLQITKENEYTVHSKSDENGDEAVDVCDVLVTAGELSDIWVCEQYE